MKKIDWLKVLVLTSFMVSFSAQAFWDSEAEKSRKAQLDANAQESLALLKNKDWLNEWQNSELINSEVVANRVIREGKEQLKVLKEANAQYYQWCSEKIFVNHCASKGRDLLFERDREIKQVIEVANQFKRTQKAQRYRQKEEADRVREANSIEQMKPKKPSQTKAVNQRLVNEAQERAKYEEKQRRAEQRIKKAEEMAKARALKRQEHQKNVEKTFTQRREAQKKHEQTLKE